MKNQTVNQVCTVVLIQQKNPQTVLILQKYFPDLVSSDYVINKLKKKTFNVWIIRVLDFPFFYNQLILLLCLSKWKLFYT